jgi:hydrogenase-4 component B
MTLALLLVSVGLLVASALAVVAVRSHRFALWVGPAAVTAASALGASASVAAVVGNVSISARSKFASALGPFHVGVDPLSALFLTCVFVVCGVSAVYSAGYLASSLGRKSPSPVIASFNLLAAAMVVVVLARDAVTFLAGWEAMSITSYVLVTHESEREEVRRAGTTYLIASHLGVAVLVVLFALLARQTGSFEFDAWRRAGAPEGHLRVLCFVLSLVGFGAKAGLWPVHVWLPAAHPAAPSHVSAVMSGVMIKMGIYGLLRTLEFVGPAPLWWGVLLVGLGAVTGVFGILHALAQRDLKRVLAFSSVENIGIITMALGLGLMGRTLNDPIVSFLGFAGALLHVVHHGLLKGLLFQSAGSVLHATGTRTLDALGGVGRRMPLTAACFLVGSAAICALPPLNGFVSEWLIYVGAFRGAATLSTGAAVPAVSIIVALALIGGLSVACFMRAYGVVFLGHARTPLAEQAHDPPASMKGAMLCGAAMCVGMGLAAPLTARFVAPAAAALGGLVAPPLDALGPLGVVTAISASLLVTVGLLAFLRARLLRRRQVTTAPTWGCGYARPTELMQYTASSFAQPVLEPFELLFRNETRAIEPRGPFPPAAELTQSRADRAEDALRSAVEWSTRLLGRLSFLQRGRVQLYLLYVLATLVALLLWRSLAGD